MSAPLPPFSCTHSPNLPELLYQLGCSLAISTYQAGKVIFIGAKDTNSLVQLPRAFKKPMGIALSGDKMAIANQQEVLVLGNSTEMARTYPKQPKTYDALFLPRAVYYSGETDIHDLEWKGGELWAVNTLFSCISKVNSDFSFEPLWKPSFISKLSPEDRCHLNGMAFQDGSLKYVSALGQGNHAESWRENRTSGGILIDTDSQDIVAENLPMPHSPRVYDKKLYVLLSASGELAEIDVNTGKYKAIKKLNGFVRGMDKLGDYLFIGLSKIRQKSSAFADLPIAKEAVFSGIVVLHIPTASIVSHLKYENSVEEIYDIKVMAGLRRPGILNNEKPDHQAALVTPEATFWAKPKPKD